VVQFQEVWVQNYLVTSCHFQASSHFCNQNTFNLQDWLTFIAYWSLIKIFCQNKMLNICWFQNNKETKTRHVSLKDEMWPQNKNANSITIWLTIHRHSWISFSGNIYVLPSTFDHMSFWRCSGDNIANDTLLLRLYLSLAHQLPDSLLEILATVQLKWPRTLPWHHISCLDYTM